MREWLRKGFKKPRDNLIHIACSCVMGLILALIAPSLVEIAQAAGTWGYFITTNDTPSTIDTSNTSAVVDTTQNEIRLPKYASKTAFFSDPAGDSLDYSVLTPTKLIHYGFTGSGMSEISSLDVTGLSNPIAACASGSYPDAVVATAAGITHYSFTGSGASANPALSVAGLTGVASIGTRSNDVAALSGGQVKYFGFTGSSMAEAPALEITSGLSNPLDIALFPDTYDCMVLQQNQALYFNSSGGGMVQNPALAITGLAAPKAISTADGKSVAVVDGSQVKGYSFSGSSFTYNTALSVTSGLTAPTCVALRPGTYDRLIVDGNQVKYYMWDGARLVYNASLSVTVSGLQNMGTYAATAAVQTNGYVPSAAANHVRVRAYHVLPNGTSVTWAVTANGSNWRTVWRVRASGGATFCDVTPDSGSTWTNIGDASQASPAVNNSQLWATVTAGSSVKWRATLATTNPSVTPLIKAPSPGTNAVVVDVDNSPNPPVISTPGSCYTTTTPTFSWTFSDPDPGDRQAGYEVLIKKQSDGSLVWDSGVAQSGATSVTVPDGIFWGTGEYRFTVQVQVFDSMLLTSGYGPPANFCITAIGNPRVTELASPSAPQTLPISITSGMTADRLPKTKAGGKVGVTVDAIGPFSSLTAGFPYLSRTATVGTPPTVQTSFGNFNKRWLTEFWTSPELSACPSGTLVKANFSGAGVNLNLPPYAAGIVVTEGTVYSDWFVVLHGRKD